MCLKTIRSLEIDVNIPEQDWARARSRTSALKNVRRAHSHRCRDPWRRFRTAYFRRVLKELDTTADPVTRTYKITFRFENPTDVTVRPGMTGSHCS